MESHRKHRGGLIGYVLNLREFDHTIAELLMHIENGAIEDPDGFQWAIHRILFEQVSRATEFTAWMGETRYFNRRPVRLFLLRLIVRNLEQKIEHLLVANTAMMDRISTMKRS